MSERSTRFWRELRPRAAKKGLTELTVRFRKDASKRYPAKLTILEDDHELRLSPQAVAAWKQVDTKEVAKHANESWLPNFETHKGSERVGLWQACAYLFGPLHNPHWSKHSYNPLVEFLVDAKEARELCMGVDEDDDWISLADLAELIDEDDGSSDVMSAGAGRSTEFPRLEDVASLVGSGTDVEKHAFHNVGVWASVHGC